MWEVMYMRKYTQEVKRMERFASKEDAVAKADAFNAATKDKGWNAVVAKVYERGAPV